MTGNEIRLMFEESSILDSANMDHIDYLEKMILLLCTPCVQANKPYFDVDAVTKQLLTISSPVLTGNDRNSLKSPNNNNTSAGMNGNNKIFINKPVNNKTWHTLPTVCFCEYIELVLRLSLVSFDIK